MASMKFPALAVTLTATLGLQACLTTPGNPHGTVSGVRGIPAGTEQIEFPVADFLGGQVTRVKYEEPLSREEYALFQGKGAQAEVIFIQTLGFEQTVLEFSKLTRDAISDFNFIRNGKVTFSDASYKASGTDLPTFVHPFNVAKSNQDCFGFQSEWDFEPEDNAGRYRKVMFGYYCAKPGEVLSAERIDETIGKIALAGITVPSNGSADTATPKAFHVAELQALANQGNQGKTGNTAFPFKPIVFYSIVGSDRVPG